MIIVVISEEDWNRMIQVIVDHVAESAIRDALAYTEVEELRRIAEL